MTLPNTNHPTPAGESQPSPADLIQTHSPRATTSAAPSPACEDSSGDDGDLALTHKQKRPRLDSGSRTVRSFCADTLLEPLLGDSNPMAADPPHITTPAASPPPSFPTPNKITLHVRKNRPLSPPTGTEAQTLHGSLSPGNQTTGSTLASSPPPLVDQPVVVAAELDVSAAAEGCIAVPPAHQDAPADSQPLAATDSGNGSAHSPQSADSSPMIPIEVADDEDVPDHMDVLNAVVIEDDDVVERFVDEFPYSSHLSKPSSMAKEIHKHLEGDDVDRDLVFRFVEWFSSLELAFGNNTRYWKQLFYENRTMWDHVAFAMGKLFCKR
jgi:hypothetical protein